MDREWTDTGSHPQPRFPFILTSEKGLTENHLLIFFYISFYKKHWSYLVALVCLHAQIKLLFLRWSVE